MRAPTARSSGGAGQRGAWIAAAAVACLIQGRAFADTVDVAQVSPRVGVGIDTDLDVDVKSPLPIASSQIQLFLDGRPLKDIPAQLLGSSAAPRYRFHLVHTAANDATWRALLGRSGIRSLPVELYLGSSDGTRLTSPSELATVSLGLFQSDAKLVIAIVLAVLMLAILIVITRMGAIQDAGRFTSWSLARVQMALWTVAITGAFLFIWACTGNVDAITPQCVGLLGVAATTALGAVSIDASKYAGDWQRIADAWIKPPPAGQRVIDVVKAEAQITCFRTRGLWKDLLFDDAGPSLHRAQMAVWTLVLLAVFGYSVATQLSMPNFDSSLIALMGVSSGMYVGFKFSE
jgi:hypothetical protein